MLAGERNDYFEVIVFFSFFDFFYAPHHTILQHKSPTFMDEIGKALQPSAKHKVAYEQ